MGKLDGKSVIVTGASRGIGAEIARVFAAEGGRVVCAARTLKEGEHQFEGSLESTVAAIKAAGGEATAVAVEHLGAGGVPEAGRRPRATAYGPIDVLVNNAALTYFVPVKDYPLNRWMRSWAVNFHAPFVPQPARAEDMVGAPAAAASSTSPPALRSGRGAGHTRTARTLMIGGTCYGAEKAALERFTQGLAAEVYQYGVSVTCVSPSQVVPTPGTVHHNLVRGLDDPRGEPPELMAKAALLLASEPLEKVTGRVTYSQQILKEFGWIDKGKGIGFERAGSGYSQDLGIR